MLLLHTVAIPYAYGETQTILNMLKIIPFPSYIAIVRPLEPRLSRCCARAFLVAIWAASALLAVPAVLYSRTWTFKYDEHKSKY